MAWHGLAIAWAAGLALSFCLEHGARPGVRPPWRRPMAALALHAGIWTTAYGLELALFRRPYFGALNVLALELLIVQVNNAKFRSLGEPFVWPDFEYFTDAIRHPRLYLPFLGLWTTLALAAGVGAALWLGLAAEPSLVEGLQAQAGGARWRPAQAWAWTCLAALLLVAAGGATAWMGVRRGGDPSFRAGEDVRRFGLVAALGLYARAERTPARPAALAGASPFVALQPTVRELPHLVSLQSESFFDARKCFPMISSQALANFDGLRESALQQGQLVVPAVGANTVRTEFGFLTGLRDAALGVHRFNPYRRLPGYGLDALPAYLRRLGYRTICVHPYHGEFYRRDEVLPLLGFDEFHDISAFAEPDKVGAYVGDRAVGEYVSRLLRDGPDVPLYVHVITMENHGPLHMEAVDPGEEAGRMCPGIPPACRDLVAYVRHLRNADAMFGALAQNFRACPREVGLCIYGDHVPIMPQVYDALGLPDGRTDYVLWSSRQHGAGREAALDVHELACAFLHRMGLAQPRTGSPPVRACAGGALAT